MNRPMASRLEESLAPRWTWRTAGGAGIFTLAVFVLLPHLERLAIPATDTATLRSVATVRLPPPSMPVPEQTRPPESKPLDLPQPELETPPERLNPRPVDWNPDWGLAGASDFSVNFPIRDPALSETADPVFAVSELDEPPRPLARLEPFYPARARLRKIEGGVLAEFIVQADGRVRDVRVISAWPEGEFERAAIQAIERWRFVPGTKEGHPVDTRVRQQVTFALRKERNGR